ncbi:MAG: type VI secretion system contractile sheath small subunit [Alphaproteobacteria bacterium]|nr:type VI secretion system contractile sheath small subunit [Alphaproteobacteria bacterium]
MANSKQHWLDRVRSPRVHITYDVEVGAAIKKKELPFVVGVLADLSGVPEKPLPDLKFRKFVEVDRDNFTDIMKIIKPRLVIRINNHLSEDIPETSVELTFNCMEDFEPSNLAKNVPSLSELYTKRTNLKNLITKLDSNDMLEQILTQLMGNATDLARLKRELLDLSHQKSEKTEENENLHLQTNEKENINEMESNIEE